MAPTVRCDEIPFLDMFPSREVIYSFINTRDKLASATHTDGDLTNHPVNLYSMVSKMKRGWDNEHAEIQSANQALSVTDVYRMHREQHVTSNELSPVDLLHKYIEVAYIIYKRSFNDGMWEVHETMLQNICGGLLFSIFGREKMMMYYPQLMRAMDMRVLRQMVAVLMQRQVGKTTMIGIAIAAAILVIPSIKVGYWAQAGEITGMTRQRILGYVQLFLGDEEFNARVVTNNEKMLVIRNIHSTNHADKSLRMHGRVAFRVATNPKVSTGTAVSRYQPKYTFIPMFSFGTVETSTRIADSRSWSVEARIKLDPAMLVMQCHTMSMGYEQLEAYYKTSQEEAHVAQTCAWWQRLFRYGPSPDRSASTVAVCVGRLRSRPECVAVAAFEFRGNDPRPRHGSICYVDMCDMGEGALSSCIEARGGGCYVHVTGSTMLVFDISLPLCVARTVTQLKVPFMAPQIVNNTPAFSSRTQNLLIRYISGALTATEVEEFEDRSIVVGAQRLLPPPPSRIHSGGDFVYHEDKRVIVCNTTRRAHVVSYKTKAPATCVAFLEDAGDLVLVGTEKGEILVFPPYKIAGGFLCLVWNNLYVILFAILMLYSYYKFGQLNAR